MNEIYTRVSIRKFQERPVEKEKIQQILRAAMQAPSTGNQQPWEFYVVTDKEKIQALSKVHQYAGCAANAPVVIVPCFKTKDIWLPEWAQIDLAIATENLWLETTSIGLGGVWLGIAPEPERIEKVGEILDLPEGLKAFALFCLGYPAERKEQENRWDASKVHWT